MAEINHEQQSFNYGEVKADLDYSSRDNQRAYYSGLQVAKDIFINSLGSAYMRPCFDPLNVIYSLTDVNRMLPFDVGTLDSRIIVFKTSRRIDIVKPIANATPIRITHNINYPARFYEEMTYVQNLQTLLLFHPDFAPLQLKVEIDETTEEETWTLTPIEFVLPAFYPFSSDVTVTTKDGPGSNRNRTFSKGGSISLKFSKPIFDSAYLGRYLWLGVGGNGITVRIDNLGEVAEQVDGENRYDSPTATVVSEIKQSEGSTERSVTPTNIATREINVAQEYFNDDTSTTHVKLDDKTKTYIPATNTIRNAATLLGEVRFGTDDVNRRYVEFDFGEEGELIDFIDDFDDNVTLTIKAAGTFVKSEDITFTAPSAGTEQQATNYENQSFILTPTSRRIDVYNLPTGAHARKIDLHPDNTTARGIDTDGTVIYVPDARSLRVVSPEGSTTARWIYTYDFESGTFLNRYPLTRLNSNPYGCIVTGADVYVYDRSYSKFYVYDNFSFDNIPDAEFRAVSSVTDLATDGFAIYALRGTRVYVYDINSRSRDSSLDIESSQFSSAGAGSPSGLFFWNDRLYVVDRTDHVMYAFDFRTKTYIKQSASDFSYVQFKGITRVSSVDPYRIFDSSAVQSGNFTFKGKVFALGDFNVINEIVQGSSIIDKVYIEYTKEQSTVKVVELTPPDIFQHLQQSIEWSEEAWNADRGYPRCAAFHKDRMLIGGTKSLPSTLLGSKQQDFYNFEPGSDALFGFDKEVPGASRIFIQNLDARQDVLIFTDRGVFALRTPEGLRPGPDDGHVELQDEYGTNPLKPQKYKNFIFYYGDDNRSLFKARYNDIDKSYVSENMSTISQQKVTQPNSLDFIENWHDATYNLALTVSGGHIHCFSFDPGDQDRLPVRAWSEWITRNGRFLEGVKVGQDYIVATERYGRVHLEKMVVRRSDDTIRDGFTNEPVDSAMESLPLPMAKGTGEVVIGKQHAIREVDLMCHVINPLTMTVNSTGRRLQSRSRTFQQVTPSLNKPNVLQPVNFKRKSYAGTSHTIRIETSDPNGFECQGLKIRGSAG